MKNPAPTLEEVSSVTHKLARALRLWVNYAKHNGWTDKNHHNSDNEGWISISESALDRYACADVPFKPQAQAEPEQAADGRRYVDITPAGLRTLEGQRRVSERMEKWQGLTAEYANRAHQFFLDYQGALGEPLPRADRAEMAAELQELHQLAENRSDAQNAFLLALCGRG